jgi:hypothetical protein
MDCSANAAVDDCINLASIRHTSFDVHGNKLRLLQSRINLGTRNVLYELMIKIYGQISALPFLYEFDQVQHRRHGK